MIIVTGATGFIGRRLVKELVEQYGSKEILCLIRPDGGTDAAKEKSGRENLSRLGLATHEADLLTGQGLRGLPRSPHLVFHLASCTDTSAPDHSINDVGTKNLLEAIGPLNADTHFVFTSSIAVNDGRADDSKPMTESTPPQRPFHIYGRKKLETEQYLEAQSKAMGFSLSVIRVCGVFGPDTIAKGLYSSLRRLVLKGSFLTRLNWPGRVSSMYVQDMAHLIREVSRHKPQPGCRELYIPSSEALTVAQMCETIYHAYGIEYKPVDLPSGVWSLLEKITGQKVLWEKIFPHKIYNSIWQANILVGQGYWNESQKIGKILGNYHLTTFKEFCARLANNEKELSSHAIPQRDCGVHPS